VFQRFLKSLNIVKYSSLTRISSTAQKTLSYLWVPPTVEKLIKNASKKQDFHAASQVLLKQTESQTTKKLQGTRHHRHPRISKDLWRRAIPQS